jgi:hypothetical protein
MMSSLPEHVEYFAVRVDSHEHVGHRDVLELGVLGVGKVDLGLPNGLDQVGVVEVERLGDFRVLQPLVLPLLPQIQVHFVVLKHRDEKSFQQKCKFNQISSQCVDGGLCNLFTSGPM